MPGARELTKMQGLRSFVSVVRSGSVRRAAQRRHYDTSTIRSHIRDLERRLHVSLLRRRPAKGSDLLTPAGEKLAPIAEGAIDAVEDLESKAGDVADD